MGARGCFAGDQLRMHFERGTSLLHLRIPFFSIFIEEIQSKKNPPLPETVKISLPGRDLRECL